MRTTALFKVGTEPTETSIRYQKLDAPTNGRATTNGNTVYLSWDAISRIESKQKADLSNTAPIITWAETTSDDTVTLTVIKPSIETINSEDEIMSNLTEEDSLMTLCTSISFDNSTAYYTLSNCKRNISKSPKITNIPFLYI